MVMSEFAAAHDGFDFNILATDISMRVLKTGVKGIYKEQLADPIPERLKKRYLLRSRDRDRRQVRIVPELRKKVGFQYLNFMNQKLDAGRTMDVIFCRNVIIYFEKDVQERLINKLCENLASGGLLFLGHSETLHGMTFPLEPVGPMVYRKVS
jgi:chemotaxis protein methyltransferase CheR